MAEYIERCNIKYEQWAVGPLNEPLMVVRKKTIDSIPTADVVPRDLLTASEEARADLGKRLAAAQQQLAFIKSADMQAVVRRGRWEYVGENSTGKIFLCTACKFPHNPNKRDVLLARADENPPYCERCGARMDGE